MAASDLSLRRNECGGFVVNRKRGRLNACSPILGVQLSRRIKKTHMLF